MLAVWAEMDVVLADQFRDGNVPTMMEPLRVAKAAFAALGLVDSVIRLQIQTLRPLEGAWFDPSIIPQ
jgi:hypothetical protein